MFQKKNKTRDDIVVPTLPTKMLKTSLPLLI